MNSLKRSQNFKAEESPRPTWEAGTSSYRWHCYVVPMITWLTVTPKKSEPTLRYSSMRALKESMLRFCPHDLFAAGISTRN